MVLTADAKVFWLHCNQTLLSIDIPALFMMRAMGGLIGALRSLVSWRLFRSAFAEMTSRRLVRQKMPGKVFILADKAQTTVVLSLAEAFCTTMASDGSGCFSYFFR